MEKRNYQLYIRDDYYVFVYFLLIYFNIRLLLLLLLKVISTLFTIYIIHHMGIIFKPFCDPFIFKPFYDAETICYAEKHQKNEKKFHVIPNLHFLKNYA